MLFPPSLFSPLYQGTQKIYLISIEALLWCFDLFRFFKLTLQARGTINLPMSVAPYFITRFMRFLNFQQSIGSNFQCVVLQDQKICHCRVPCGYRFVMHQREKLVCLQPRSVLYKQVHVLSEAAVFSIYPLSNLCVLSLLINTPGNFESACLCHCF